MGKTKFVIGTILTVLTVATCAVGTMMLYEATHLESEAAIAAIALVPIAFMFYFAQIVFALPSQILLWLNFGRDGYGKIASAIIAAIGILSVLLSGTYVLYLLLR